MASANGLDEPLAQNKFRCKTAGWRYISFSAQRCLSFSLVQNSGQHDAAGGSRGLGLALLDNDAGLSGHALRGALLPQSFAIPERAVPSACRRKPPQ